MEKWEEGGIRGEKENWENRGKEMRLAGGENGSVCELKWRRMKEEDGEKWERRGKKFEPSEWRKVSSLKKKKK